jgi:diguanylate cyclase (GGDEF)-like protein/PAS domain S-box-containing protein
MPYPVQHTSGGAPKRAFTLLRHALPQGQTLPEDVWRRRHRALLWLLWIHVIGIPGFAVLEGFSLWHGLLDASPIAALALCAGFAPGRKMASGLVSAGLLTCSAVLVHLTHGLIEAHFHFFVVVVVLTIYEDWLPFLLAVAYVLLHHGVMGTVDPASVYAHGDARHNPWKWAGIHAGFVAAAGIAAVMAWRLNEDVRHRLRALVSSSGEAILEIDGHGRVVGWNPAAHAMLGYSPEEIVGRPATTLAPCEGADEMQEVVAEALAGEVVQRHEALWRRADGGPVELSLTASPITDAGMVVGASIIARDISERRALQHAEERYRTLVESVPAITYVAEAGTEGRWHYVSPQIEKLLGYTPEEWENDPTLWYSRVHPEDRERVMAEEERFEATREPLAIEYQLLARDGTSVCVRDDAVFRPLGGGESRIMDGVLTDVTERKRLEDQLRHLATHDQMTGLYNRHRFEEELRHQVSYSRRYGTAGALFVLDLDAFKSANDTLGHFAGDALLKAIAGVLGARLREVDVLARLGGDEFAVFLPEVGLDAARAVAEDLVERIRAERITVAGSAVETTTSLGVALLDPSAPLDAERLLMQADTAMYEAKYAGGDAFAVFAPEGRTRAGAGAG